MFVFISYASTIDDDCRIRVGNLEIVKVIQYEYLCMIIEEQLNLDRQIECIYKGATKAEYNIKNYNLYYIYRCK